MAAGWKVYKSSEPMNGNTLYVHIVDPVSAGQNYLETYKLISETFPAEVQDLYGKTKDAFVPGGLGRLNLTLVSALGGSVAVGSRSTQKGRRGGDPAPPFSRVPLCRRRSEREVGAGVEAVHLRLERRSHQREDAVVEAQAERPGDACISRRRRGWSTTCVSCRSSRRSR